MEEILKGQPIMNGKQRIESMNRIIKNASILLLGTLVTSFASCNNDDPIVFDTEQTNNTSEIYEEKSIEPVNPGEDQVLELYGELEGYKNTESDANETRSLHLGNQEYNINGYPLIYKKSVEENWGVFYFKKIGSTTITKRALPYTIQPLDENGDEVDEGRRAKIKITARPATTKDNPKVNSINLDNGETFSEGEWYMSGILGTGESLKNGVITTQKFNPYSIDAPADPDDRSQKLSNAIEWDASSADKMSRQINVPLKLMWSKLKGTTDNVAGRTIGGASAKDLKFAVTGALISFRSRSDIFDDVYLHGMYIKSWNLSFTGHFSEINLNSITDDMLRSGGSLPYEYRQADSQTPDRATGTNWNFMRANFFAKRNSGTKYSFLIPGGRQANSQLKIVAMPIVPPTNDFNRRNKTHVGWIISKTGKRSESATSTLQTISIKNNTNPNPLTSEDGSTTFDPNAIHEGRYYNFNVDMETDLMITEIFSHNPDGNNYGWIELYNGTMHTIDLSNYALGRSKYTQSPLNNSSYFTPIPTDVTAHGTYPGAGYGQGAIMPLTMETTAPMNPRNSNNLAYNESLYNSSVMKAKWNVGSDIMTAMHILPEGQQHRDKYWGREKTYFGYLPDVPTGDYYTGEDYTAPRNRTAEERRMLPPGKTIIFLMVGYFRDIRWGTSVTPSTTWNRSLTAAKQYLHGPQMFRAYKAGYLHDIVVAFSGANQAFNAFNYYTRATNDASPVLHKGDEQGMYLVRILPNGYKRIIDAFGPLDSDAGKAKTFYDKLNNSKRIYIRKDHIIFPDYSAGFDSHWDMSDYSSGRQYSYPSNTNIWTSAGTRSKHEKIKPNYPDKYDGTDRYTPKQRTW